MIPGWNCPVYYLYVVVGLGGALPALYSEFGYILYRGAGKNGSSVAVSDQLAASIFLPVSLAPNHVVTWWS
jgi:hypothetical protein